MSAADIDPRALALRSSDPRVRLRAIADLAAAPQTRLTRPALDALVACAGSPAKTISRRAIDALAILGSTDDRIVPALRGALDSSEPRLRWGAAYALGLIGDALDVRVLGALLEALGSDDGDVRWAALELIVRLGRREREPVRRALLALETSAAPNARKMALYCLRDLKVFDGDILAMAERAAGSHDTHVRLAALALLGGDSGDAERRAAILLRCLEEDRHEGVRRAAASALGRLAHLSPAVMQALRRAAADSNDASLRKAARQALGLLERTP